MDYSLKEAFDRIKSDISQLSKEVYTLGENQNMIFRDILLMKEYIDNKTDKNSLQIEQKLNESMHLLHAELLDLRERINNLKESLVPTPPPTHIPTNPPLNPTISQGIPTNQQIPEALKPLKLTLSTGNEGVPTDKPTDKPTDRNALNLPQSLSEPEKNDFDHAIKILESLDGVKKEIRRKFKNLTNMEMEVFSLLYSLEENGEDADYRLLASKLSLSESSIRDYIGRITLKGIPILKEKINNKKVILRISSDLKKIADLNTILQLRGI